MKTQVIQDNKGLPAGVFIPIEDWENIKKQYPNIENISSDIPQWHKELIDKRLLDIDNPSKIKSIESLNSFLD